MKTESKRILAICPIGLGNFLLLLPALKACKEHYPGHKFTLLALKGGIAPVAKRYDFIDEIIEINATGKMGFVSKLKFIGALRNRFDISISFFPSNRREYNLLSFLARIPKRIGYRYFSSPLSGLGFLNTDRVAVSETLHDLEQNFTALGKLGIQKPLTLGMVPLKLSEGEKEFAEKWISEKNLSGRRLVGMHPGSSAEHGMDKKRWPVERFAELAGLMGPDARFLIFGGHEETAIKSELAGKIGTAGFVVNTKSYFEAAALIARCHYFISNDSGLMHTATACGVPTCGIFGPTSDIRTAPYGTRHITVRASLDCAPCWTIKNVGKRETCRYADFRCLQRLPSTDVYNRIKAWM